MIVLDASFLFQALAGAGPDAERTRRLLDLPRPWCAPGHLDAEILQALRRHALSGRMTSERGEQALADFAAMPIDRYPLQPLLRRTWALRNVLSAYDAMYVVLAEAIDGTLVTCDAKLASAARELVRVDLRTQPA